MSSFDSVFAADHPLPQQHHRWAAVGDTGSNLTGSGIELKTFRVDSDVFTHYLNRQVLIERNFQVLNERMHHKMSKIFEYTLLDC